MIYRPSWVIYSSTHSARKPITGDGIMCFMPLPRYISPKVNIITRLEFERAYNDVAARHFSHYAMGILSVCRSVCLCVCQRERERDGYEFFFSLVGCILLYDLCLHINACIRWHFHSRRNLSETSRQIHLPWKQRLINRKGHRRAANEGMDSYR